MNDDNLKPPDFRKPGSKLCTVAAVLCPTLLAFAVLAIIAQSFAQKLWIESVGGPGRSMDVEYPIYLRLLMAIFWLSCAAGCLVTFVTFILGLVMRHWLAIILSVLTFVLSLPVLWAAATLGFYITTSARTPGF
jgi:hypothetical protein